MRDVAIVGTGITPFGKFADASLKSLTAAAVGDALTDAAVTARNVEVVVAANAIAGLVTGQEMIRGQVALRAMEGFGGTPTFNVENACAGGASALHLAWLHVASGAADLALAFGAEKMSHPDKERTLAAIGTALDVSERRDPGERSPFMALYAERIRAYMQATDATVEDFAEIAVKAQRNGARNPNAQYGSTEITAADVLASPTVAEPLTRLMCAPIGDGAAAIVLASPEVAARADAPIWVRASTVVSGVDPGDAPPATRRAALRAYEQAGLGPEDLDVVELHDTNAPAEVLRYEALGLAPEHGGVDLARSGATALGGRLPVNPSGGLQARGHPIGATGCAQVVELVDQLRGRAGDRQVPGARVALAENGGGNVAGDTAAEAVHILAR